MRGSRSGGGGVVTRIPDPRPLENHKIKGFLRNTAPEPLENHKAIQPAFNVGLPSARQRNAIQWHFAGWPMVVRFVYWIGFLLVILAQTPPSHSVKEVDDTTKLSKLCTWNPTEETFWIHVLTCNAQITTKVVCFSRLLKCFRGLTCKQCGTRSGAVCFGSTLFASILNSSVMLGNYSQQTTSADDIFRCIYFLAL